MRFLNVERVSYAHPLLQITNYAEKKMPSYTVAANKIEQNTAAEPRSLARPESSCRSVPIRSTTVSIAELMISTIITSSQLPIQQSALDADARQYPSCRYDQNQ